MKKYAQFLIDENLEEQCVEDTWEKQYKLSSEKLIASRDARSKSIISAKEKVKMETDLKNIWNAHLKVILNYKVNLQCHIDLVDIESNTFILSFFQEVKRADPDFFIKLSYKTPDEWMLLDMKPMLPDYDSLCTKLHHSRDILTFLVRVYEDFTALKEN
uniref:Kinetochore protein SPC25 n=1 Tax=Timema poppense TaxID=170557 RepID=A0A7R9HAJ4_TIMPO|nr:unnamed protein product [Timema poppensis]